MIVAEADDDGWDGPAAGEYSDSEAGSEEEPEAEAETEEDKRLTGMVRTIHKNLGHPSKRALARALRMRGAPAAAIRAVKRLT